jgi:hypothetical protein
MALLLIGVVRLAAGAARRPSFQQQTSSHRLLRDARDNAAFERRFASHCGVGALQRPCGTARAVNEPYTAIKKEKKGPRMRGPFDATSGDATSEVVPDLRAQLLMMMRVPVPMTVAVPPAVADRDARAVVAIVIAATRIVVAAAVIIRTGDAHADADRADANMNTECHGRRYGSRHERGRCRHSKREFLHPWFSF